MFTRRGKYVVVRLPGREVVGAATTLLDAADVAMEDARNGPGKYVIEQPPIEVDVSKAYGVLAQSATVPGVPEDLVVTSVGVTDATVVCVAVEGADGYQWYLSGAPDQVTVGAGAYFSGLTAATGYTVQVAAIDGGLMGGASAAVGFTTLALSEPEWSVVPAQALTVGGAYSLDLAGYASSPGGDTPSFSVVSGILPAGLSIVGTRIVGTPTAVETQTPVIRATAAGGTADSAAIVMESLNADVTAPDAPTNFAATGYSATQVRLSWTNPADDATVVGERKSGFQGVDIYRDGVKVARVLAASATPEEYLAATTVTALWKVRSLDFVTPNPNKGPFTAELSAGPLALTPSSPESVVAVRNSATSATVTWVAGGGAAPTGYRVYMALSLGGTYSQVYSGTTASHTQTSGFTGSQTPYFYVIAVVGGQDSPASAIVSASLGTLTKYYSTDFEEAALTDTGVVLWSPTGHDAYDHTVDNPCEVSVVKSYAGTKSLRVQLTHHRLGTNEFPANNEDTLVVPENPDWHYKNGALSNAQLAHRNEFKWPAPAQTGAGKASSIKDGEEHWMGFAVYLPGPSDPDGDREWKATSWWSYSFGPQLHPVTGGQSPVIAFDHGSGKWPARSGSLAGIVHPSGAPVVRYKRGGDQYGSSTFLNEGSSAAKLRVEWDAVAGASTYKVYRSVRSQGPFEEVAQWLPATAYAKGRIIRNETRLYHCHVAGTSATSGGGPVGTVGRQSLAITNPYTDGSVTWLYVGTVDLVARQYAENDLGSNATLVNADAGKLNCRNSYVYVRAVVGGVQGTPSFICPAPRNEWGASVYGENGSRADFALGTAERGQWVRFVFRYRLSTTNTGYLQVWKDGVEVVWSSGINIGNDSFAGDHYWRMGIYSNVITEDTSLTGPVPADWPSRETVYFDNMTMLMRTGGNHLRTDTSDGAYAAVDPATAEFT